MEYLLVIIFVIALISIYVGARLSTHNDFDHVVLFFLFFVSLHALYTFIYEFLSLPIYVDSCFPFGLVYGPIFYFSLKTAAGGVITKKALLHLIPFFLLLIPFFLLVFSPDFRAEYYKISFKVLYRLISISMVGYLVMAFVSNRKQTELLGKTTRLITIGVTILSTMALMILIMSILPIEHTEETVRQFPRYLIYTAMLLQVIAVLQYQVGRFIKDNLVADLDISPSSQEDKKPQYEKSLITDDTMDIYQDRLKMIMKNRIFQDMELSLEGLAKQIGAPKHHLTQLLNLRMKKTFNQYINGLRIEYACELLEQNPREYSIEELAYECGFNSKVSFNRNFKNITGFTPSEYRGQLEKRGSI